MPMLGDVFLNTVYEESPGRSVKTTDHPIEDGQSVTDYGETDPKTIDISGVVVGPDASIRKVKLEQYMTNKTLLKYRYRNTLSNVLIVNFKTTHDKDVKGGFKFDITLKEIKVVKPSTIKTTNKNTKIQASKKSNKGHQQTKGTKPAKIYVVKPGDTLSEIGEKYKINWKKIYEKNKGVIGNDPNKIYPGQKLIIPV
jgi:LysM repeat protein